jgi:ribosomal protein L11 methyltransferase
MGASRFYPALDLSWPAHPGDDLIGALVAALDDCHVTAVEDTATGCRIFFANLTDRDRALDTARDQVRDASAAAVEVSDESWAERSQAALTAVQVGTLTIAPPWSPVPADVDPAHWITIQPSMGFGTGHHQSTRLCLALLQNVPLAGARVLDVGTGSGVLAIAAGRLGAARVEGLDYDPDALANAQENVERNQVQATVSVRLGSLGAERHGDWDDPSLPAGGPALEAVRAAAAPGARSAARAEHAAAPTMGHHPTFDLVLANLTGATLLRLADDLIPFIASGGSLIVSGFQRFERDTVADTFRDRGLTVERDMSEDTWTGILLRKYEVRSTKYEVRRG